MVNPANPEERHTIGRLIGGMAYPTTKDGRFSLDEGLEIAKLGTNDNGDYEWTPE